MQSENEENIIKNEDNIDKNISKIDLDERLKNLGYGSDIVKKEPEKRIIRVL